MTDLWTSWFLGLIYFSFWTIAAFWTSFHFHKASRTLNTTRRERLSLQANYLTSKVTRYDSNLSHNRTELARLHPDLPDAQKEMVSRPLVDNPLPYGHGHHHHNISVDPSYSDVHNPNAAPFTNNKIRRHSTSYSHTHSVTRAHQKYLLAPPVPLSQNDTKHVRRATPIVGGTGNAPLFDNLMSIAPPPPAGGGHPATEAGFPSTQAMNNKNTASSHEKLTNPPPPPLTPLSLSTPPTMSSVPSHSSLTITSSVPSTRRPSRTVKDLSLQLPTIEDDKLWSPSSALEGLHNKKDRSFIDTLAPFSSNTRYSEDMFLKIPCYFSYFLQIIDETMQYMVVLQWFISNKNYSLFIGASLAIFLFYRILSTFLLYRSVKITSKFWILGISQFFHPFNLLFYAMVISWKTNKNGPCLPQKWIHLNFVNLQSFPFIFILCIFLVRQNAKKDTGNDGFVFLLPLSLSLSLSLFPFLQTCGRKEVPCPLSE